MFDQRFVRKARATSVMRTGLLLAAVACPGVGARAVPVTVTLPARATQAPFIKINDKALIGANTNGGIEIGDGLDPASTTALVTGLTFEGAGMFTGTQTPLLTNVAAAVPEPPPWVLLLAGTLGVVALGRRWRSV